MLQNIKLGVSPLKKEPFKVIRNAFYLEIFTFLSGFSGYVEKRLDKKVKVNFKIYDVTDWTTNNYNTYIVQYLKK